MLENGMGSNETPPIIFSYRAIGIINFERLSPNFIADTMNWFLSSMLDLKHFCIKAYRNRNFMVT